MTISTVSPQRTYALVVGLEKYNAGTSWNLNGPANDARKFADWLCSRGVPPENIFLFLSLLDEGSNASLVVQSATRDNLYRAITDTLRQKQGDLLYRHKGMTRAGENPRAEINKHIESACLFLLLITPSFMNYYYRKLQDINLQVELVMQRQKAKQAEVIPILLESYANWKRALSFGELQPLPSNGKFVSDMIVYYGETRQKHFVKLLKFLEKKSSK